MVYWLPYSWMKLTRFGASYCAVYFPSANVRVCHQPVPVAAWSKAWVCGRSPAEIVGSNPTGGMDVCCECCVLSGRVLCDGLIIRPEESYRLWCVVVCDLETSSRMRRPWPALGRSAYIYMYMYMKWIQCFLQYITASEDQTTARNKKELHYNSTYSGDGYPDRQLSVSAWPFG